MDNNSIDTLLEYCRNGNAKQRVEAVLELVARDVYSSIAVVADLRTSPDIMVRCTVAEALADLGARQPDFAGNALSSMLNDPEAIVRSAAIDAIGILKYTPAIDKIRTMLLNDDDALVRASAAETLGDLGDKRALVELKVAMHDEDDAVRAYAANSIGLLGDSEWLPVLSKYIEVEKSPAVKIDLYGAQYRIGDAKSLTALLQLANSADITYAWNILNTLDDLTDSNAVNISTEDVLSIRTAVKNLAIRIPIVSGDVQQVLDNLDKKNNSR